jgi:hypothetical protein
MTNVVLLDMLPCGPFGHVCCCVAEKKNTPVRHPIIERLPYFFFASQAIHHVISVALLSRWWPFFSFVEENIGNCFFPFLQSDTNTSIPLNFHGLFPSGVW